MKSYLKFLSRNKLYTAIEAVGLAVSLAFVIVIGMSVIDQLRIRGNVPEGLNLYALGPNSYGTEYKNLETLSSIPEIKSLAAVKRSEFLMSMDGRKSLIMALIADPGILDYVPQRVIRGNISQFRDGGGVLITESAAQKWFAGKDPLGEYVTVANLDIDGLEQPPVAEPIVAVIGDPSYTALDDFDLMFSFRSRIPAIVELVESDIFNDGSGQFVNVLADMVPGFDLEAFSSKYKDLLDQYLTPDEKEKMMAVPFSELFFSKDNYEELRQGNRLYLTILVILGLVLLVSAILNYTNLNLAISSSRSKEMATRQLVGGSRSSIVLRVMGESLVFTIVCYLVAILLAVWVAPLLNNLKPDGLSVPFHVPATGSFVLLSLGLVTVIGILSGLFPALTIASYRPLDIVSGKERKKRKMGANHAFIVIQTVLSVLLLVASITLEAQLSFMLRQDTGASPVKNLYHFWPGLYEPMTSLGNELTSHAHIKNIGYGEGFPTRPWGIQSGPEGAFYSTIACDSTAFRLLGFRVKEQWGQSLPGTFWLSENAGNFIGISEEDSSPSRLWGPYPNPSITSIGGIIENFRGSPVNVAPRMGFGDMQELLAVEIRPSETLSGIWIETDDNQDEFDRWFKTTVRSYYQQTKGLSDVLSLPGGICGYLDEIISRDHNDFKRYVRLVEIFTLVAVLLSILGMIAMSCWFADSNAKTVAIRKVFGSTVAEEVKRISGIFLLLYLISIVVGIPLSVWMAGRFLENYPERISGYWWIFVATVLITGCIAFVSVIWQVLKAAKTNPAVELKKE